MTSPSSNDEGDSADDNAFRIGVVLAIVGTFFFALKSIFIKLALAEGADPVSILMLRMAFSLPVYALVCISLCRKGKMTTSPALILKATLMGFGGYYLASLLDISGLTYISAQLERITLFTYPAMIAVLAWMFLGERLTKKIVLAIALCYLGVMLMYVKERSLFGGQHVFLGMGLVVASAMSYAIYIVLAKPTIQAMGSPAFTSLAMIGSTVFMGIHFFLTHPASDLLSYTPKLYGYGILLAFLCTAIPSYMVNEAIARIGATRTTVIGSAGPVLTMTLAIVVLSEPTSVQHFVGMMVAIAGVSLVASR